MASVQTVQFSAQARIPWRAFRGRDSGQWVAICDALKLTTQGDSWEDLMIACSESVQLLFLDLYEEGDLESFLRSRGWVPVTAIPRPGAHGDVRFDIPVQVELQPNHGEERLPL